VSPHRRINVGRKSPNPAPPKRPKDIVLPPAPPPKKYPVQKVIVEHTSACLGGRLEEGKYCAVCGMPWYNCLCCHED